MATDLQKKTVAEIFQNVKTKDIMKQPVVTIREDEDFSKVQELFLKHRITHLCVIDSRRQLVGIISQKYLYKTQSPRKIISDEMNYDPEILADGDSFYTKDTLDSYILRTIMHKHPFTLNLDDSLADAVSAMNNRNLGCIPIINGDKQVKGLVTSHEIVNFVSGLLGK